MKFGEGGSFSRPQITPNEKTPDTGQTSPKRFEELKSVASAFSERLNDQIRDAIRFYNEHHKGAAVSVESLAQMTSAERNAIMNEYHAAGETERFANEHDVLEAGESDLGTPAPDLGETIMSVLPADHKDTIN